VIRRLPKPRIPRRRSDKQTKVCAASNLPPKSGSEGRGRASVFVCLTGVFLVLGAQMRVKAVSTKKSAPKQSLDNQIQSALTWLKSHSTRATLEGMARYSIPSDHAYGVAMKDI
jgi:hypothetical protein